MGCVLPAGQGQAPARQAALGAGLPQSVPCTTVNKMCGSGMKTVMMAYDGLHARPQDIVVAGGMESMTNAPYLLPKMRGGARLGHAEVKDHMFLDGLEDAYDKGRLMGTYAEDTAQHYQFTREAQDAFAIESLKRSKRANEDGSFAKEIVAVSVKARSGAMEVERDEQPFTADPGKIPKLKPAFRDGGTVTAANSSSISDGAAALVLMRESEAERRKLDPIARIAGVAGIAQAPAWFTTAPVAAIERLLEQVGWSAKDVGLYEINEAFAVVAMCAMRDLCPAAREGQRARRRLRAGPPDRRVGGAHPGHAARRHGEIWAGARASPRSASAAAKPPRWPSSAWRENHPHRDRHRRAGREGVGHPRRHRQMAGVEPVRARQRPAAGGRAPGGRDHGRRASRP